MLFPSDFEEMPQAVLVAIEDSLVMKLNGLTAARRQAPQHPLAECRYFHQNMLAGGLSPAHNAEHLLKVRAMRAIGLRLELMSEIGTIRINFLHFYVSGNWFWEQTIKNPLLRKLRSADLNRSPLDSDWRSQDARIRPVS